MSLVSLVAVRLLRLRPERRFKWEPMTGALEGGEADVEDPPASAGRREFPMVLVQIPMYNEKEVRRPDFRHGVLHWYRLKVEMPRAVRAAFGLLCASV